MKFSYAATTLLFVTSSATAVATTASASMTAKDGGRFPANSAAGRKLLRHATVLEQGRHLGYNSNNNYNNNNNNANYNNNNANYNANQISNLAGLYFKFEGCSSYRDRGLDYYEYWQQYHADGSVYEQDVNNYEAQLYEQQQYAQWQSEQAQNQQAFQNWKYYQQQQGANNQYDENNQYDYGNANYENAQEEQEEQEQEEENNDNAADENADDNNGQRHRRRLGNYNQDYFNYGNAYGNGDNDWENNVQQQEEYNDNEEQEQEQVDVSSLPWTHLVRFTLCSDTACGSCSGQYAVDRTVFLQAWWQHQLLLQASTCGTVRSQCDCSANPYNRYYQTNNYYYYQQQCHNACYKKQGQYSCLNYDGDQNDSIFDLSGFLQCGETDYYPEDYAYYQTSKNNNKNNNAGYYVDPDESQNAYYIGPYCTEDENLYLKAYMDQDCSSPAEHFVFKSEYKSDIGSSFPYMDTPMLKPGNCVSCQAEQAEQNNNNNNYDGNQAQQQANGMCSLAEDDDSVKCVYTQNSDMDTMGGCLFLDILPELDGRNERTRNSLSQFLTVQETAATVLVVVAVILFLAVLTLCVCGKRKPSSTPSGDKTEELLGRDIRDDGDDESRVMA